MFIYIYKIYIKPQEGLPIGITSQMLMTSTVCAHMLNLDNVNFKQIFTLQMYYYLFQVNIIDLYCTTLI